MVEIDQVTGFTAILCGAGPCRGAAGPELAARLRDAVGATRHGVLVIAGCTVGRLACMVREPGPVLVVQPCDADRRPIGRAVHVGPIRARDIATVAEWLGRTAHEPARLPVRLTGLFAGAASN